MTEKVIQPTEEDRSFNMMRFILLVLIGSAIFLLPYMRGVYYDQFIAFLNITPIELGGVLAVYGTCSTIGTFFSGVLADRYSAKWLLVISLVATGLGGFILLSRPSYYGFLGLYILWGFSITLTYNSAHYKAIRYCGRADQQGRMYGLVGGGRKIVQAVIAFIAAAVFAAYVGTTAETEELAFIYVTYIYTATYFVIALVVIIFWKGDKPVPPEDRWKLRDAIVVLKHPATWYLGFTLYFVYGMSLTLGVVLAPYMRNVLEIDPGYNVILNTIRSYVFPFIGGFVFGLFLDRTKNKIRLCQIAMAIACVFMVSMLFIPLHGTFWHAVFFGALGGFYIGQQGAYLTIFSLLDEANIPKKITGSIIGVAISIGFLPDITMNYFANWLVGTYGYHQGMHYNMMVATVYGVISIILYGLFQRYLRKYHGAA
ncbi:MAG: MFS transporter [Desulfovibrionaceae bacterium]|nr:MFS transporter [Desulfovibrionaceae bacterium]